MENVQQDSQLEASLSCSLREVLGVITSRLDSEPPTYFGVPTKKNPLDLWSYQEIIFELRPDVVIEIGNWCGGSALALAHLLDHVGGGRVIGIDINHDRVGALPRAHSRINWVTGSAAEVVETVREQIGDGERVLVIEDASHTYADSMAILQAYSPLVPVGSYYIVEDTIHHHGLDEGPSPGPYEAVEDFLRTHTEFVSNPARERFLITFNPKGFLLRIR